MVRRRTDFGGDPTLTATIQDAAGNTVTSGADSTATVAFGYAASSGAGTVSGLGNDTAVNGVASKTVTGVLVGSVTIRATSGRWSMVPGTRSRSRWCMVRRLRSRWMVRRRT
jgi:hypothetical protein